jgi:putative ABC transport system ATP-binding protein
VNSGPVARLVAVEKSYRESASTREVLRGLDLELARGEFVALVGRSGSGKTSLLHVLSGIDWPTRGRVELFGEDLTNASDDRRTRVRRERVGLVFQFFNLLPTLTVEENLLLPLELADRLDAAGRARAAELLEAVGLASRRREFPDRLSGGEQQRAAVARALVHEPDLVLADEPTGNLDEHNAGVVLELFERLLRPARRTLLLVTHSTAAAGVADRVLDLRDGRLAPHPRSGAS